MEIYRYDSTDDYAEIQVERSISKFRYCKVSFRDVQMYRKILSKYEFFPKKILCLGTRNGREVDLFRYVFFYPTLASFVRLFEVKRYGYSSLLKQLEKYKRSNINKIEVEGVYGVEINPSAKRQDIQIENFDNLSNPFFKNFDLIYSNSFDQSQDPLQTAQEWFSCLNLGGHIIIGFNDSLPSKTDPTGLLSIQDILKLFPGELVYYKKNNSMYNDAIIKKII